MLQPWICKNVKIDFKLCPPDQSRKCPPSISISKDPCYQAVWPENWIKFCPIFCKNWPNIPEYLHQSWFLKPKTMTILTHLLSRQTSVGPKDRKHLVLVHFFNFITGNQCLQYCNQILTLLSLASFILPASLTEK